MQLGDSKLAHDAKGFSFVDPNVLNLVRLLPIQRIPDQQRKPVSLGEQRATENRVRVCLSTRPGVTTGGYFGSEVVKWRRMNNVV
jgi:hypothetical protein